VRYERDVWVNAEATAWGSSCMVEPTS
jgi:hypothetical protein